MGFNRRKMEDQQRQLAEQEAAARRATDAQVLNRRLERAASQTNANVVLADHWCSHYSGLLVSVGAVPRLPDHQRD